MAACLALLLAADRRPFSSTVDADGRWDAPVFRGFSSFSPEGFRVSGPRSEILLGGLGRGAAVSLNLAVSSALPRAQGLRVLANGTLVLSQDVGGRYGVLVFPARADDQGVLRLRLVADPVTAAGAFRVTWLRVEQPEPAPTPLFRAGLYGLLLALALAVGVWLRPGATWIPVLPAVAFTLLLAALLLSSRLLLLGHLTHVAVAAMATVVAGSLCNVLGFPRQPTAWMAGAFALKVFFGTLSTFPSIDAAFHAHNVEHFRLGQVVASAVSDSAGAPVPIPYPPALYALLAPLVRAGDTSQGEATVKLSIVLLEGTAPLLLFGLMRSLGATRGAAAWGAAAYAAMPESLLVLAKGIAANVLGSWLGLSAMWAIAGGASWVLAASLSALAFLGHPGSAACLAGLVGLWQALRVAVERRRWSHSLRTLGLVAIGAAIAVLVYYREVMSLTMSSLAATGSSSLLAVRWVHLGKVVQNTVLKYGAGGLILAVVGLRSNALAEGLRSLLRAWLLGATVLAALAVLTPFSLRFEYFALPAVAAAAGVGAQEMIKGGRPYVVGILLGVSLGIQGWLALATFYGAFDLINVIIPSPRWPLLL